MSKAAPVGAAKDARWSEDDVDLDGSRVHHGHHVTRIILLEGLQEQPPIDDDVLAADSYDEIDHDLVDVSGGHSCIEEAPSRCIGLANRHVVDLFLEVR